MRFPTRSELYQFIRTVARHEDRDIGRPVVRQPGVSKAIIPAAYVSGNPKIQQWWESSTTLGTKTYKTLQAFGNRYAAPAASDSIAIGHDPDGNKEILGKIVNVGSGVSDTEYWMGVRPAAPGNSVFQTLNVERSTASGSFVTVKRTRLTGPGRFRIKGELSVDAGAAAECRVGIELEDGSIVVASATATENAAIYPAFASQFTLDMDQTIWNGFLVIQLLKSAGGGLVYVQNVTISYADATAVMSTYNAVVTD